MADDFLKHLCQKLASRIGSRWPMYDDYAVRADAGDAGMIYVALRGARGEVDVGRKFSAEVESLVARELEEVPDGGGDDVDFAISLGSGNKDLLLQIELRYL